MRSLRQSYKKRLHRKIVTIRKLRNNKSKRQKQGGSEKVKCCMCNKKMLLHLFSFETSILLV